VYEIKTSVKALGESVFEPESIGRIGNKWAFFMFARIPQPFVDRPH